MNGLKEKQKEKSNLTINTFEFSRTKNSIEVVVHYVNARYEQNFKTHSGYFVLSGLLKNTEKNTVLLKFPSESAHS